MRNISYYHTTKQVRERTKTVTRRIGWENLKPGDRLQAIEKGQGLKKGEHVNKLCVIEVVTAEPEQLNAILSYPPGETAKEGFPEMTNRQFMEFFMKTMGVDEHRIVTRIEFKYID